MNYIVNPSLEHIALVKVAASFWNESDIRDSIASFSFPSRFAKSLKAKAKDEKLSIEREIKDIWDNIEKYDMARKIADLPLPQQLKDKLSVFIKILGFKILKWMFFIYQNCGLEVSLPKEFHWTQKGTLDEMKTAEVLIKDESIDVATRYKLSCIYCSLNDILELWNKMLGNGSKYFYSPDSGLLTHHELVTFFTFKLRNKIDILDYFTRFMSTYDSAYKSALYFTIVRGNKVATEYLLQHLEAAEKKKFLIKSGIVVAHGITGEFEDDHGDRKENYSEIMCALLSQMDKVQQMIVFENEPGLVLRCLLEWPFQTFFMQTANCMWNFLSEMAFGLCLIQITLKMIRDYKDYDYHELFKQFWEQSPESYKSYVRKELPVMHQILFHLFQSEDVGNFKILYQDATTEEKRKIFYDDRSILLCSYLLDSEKLNLLKFFIAESLPTKDLMMKFKSDFEEKRLWKSSVNSCKMRKEKLQKFCDILNDFISEFGKRKCIDNGNDSVKKRCTELETVDCVYK